MKAKKLLSILLTLILLGGLAYGVTYATLDHPIDCELTVLSYNIRCLSVDSNEDDKWNNRKDALIKHINDNDPNIIGMQEVTILQNNYLDDVLVQYDKVSYNRDSWLNSEASPIFFKKDAFVLLDEGNFWLSDTPEMQSKGWDGGSFRVCTYAVLKDKMSGKIFTFFNTHLDNAGVVARTEGLSLILDRISLVDTPVILTGDFNFNENDDNYQVAAQVLDDTKYIAEESFYAGTYHGYNVLDTTSRSPIDFILVGKNDFRVKSYSVLMEKVNGVFTSDHYAVRAELQIL